MSIIWVVLIGLICFGIGLAVGKITMARYASRIMMPEIEKIEKTLDKAM